MANINISDGSTYVVGVTDPTWVGADGDTITISNESEVVIDADQYLPTNKWGNVSNLTIGTFRIKNAGTNGRMLVFDMNSTSNLFRIELKGEMIVEGDFLEVATGDGTSGQTIDFSSVGTNSVSLDEVTCIWIEETPGGKKWPFTSLGDPSVDYLNMPLAGVSGSQGTGASGFGGAGASSDWAVGRNFNFNRTTKVATFGDGTNGLVIPNGCKAYISNIQITGPFTNRYQDRANFDFAPEGSANFSNVEFLNIYFTCSQFTNLICSYVSAKDRIDIRSSYGKTILDNFVMCTDTQTNQNYQPKFGVITPLGANSEYSNLYLEGNHRNVSGARYLTYFALEDCVLMENIYINLLDRNSTDYAGYWLYPKDLTIKNINTIGYVTINDASDSVLLDWKYRGSTFAPQFTAPASNYQTFGLQIQGATNGLKVINWEHIQGSTSPAFPFYVSPEASNVEIYNAYANLDCNGLTNWGNIAIRNYGDNNTFKNIEIDGYAISYFIANEINSFNAIYDNIYGNTSRRANFGLGNFDLNMTEVGGVNNIVVGLPSNVGVILGRSAENNIGTAPNIQYGGFIKVKGGGPLNNEYEYEIGGGAFVGGGNTLLPNIGSFVGMGNKNPLRGFKGFLNVSNGSRFLAGGLNLEECNFYYKMSLANDSLPTTWTQLSITETGSYFNAYNYLQSAFDAIKGANYDSNEGINFAWKVENATDPASSRVFYSMNILCEVDNDYVSNDASITLEGGDATTKYEIVRASDNVVLYSFIGTGTHDFYLANNYLTEVYFKRYRDVSGSYDLLLNTQYTSQPLIYGFNGNIKLYVGEEVQVASTDIQAIWEYTNRTLTEGGFTNADRATLDKGLTTGKFLALK